MKSSWLLTAFISAWLAGSGLIAFAAPASGEARRTVGNTTIIPASCYSFVREDVFVDKHINRRIVIPARNVTLVKATNRLTEDRLVDGVLMNNSVSVDRVEQVLHRAVPRMKIIDADSAASLNVSFNGKRAKGDEVAMFRPHIETSGTGGTAPPPFAATSPQSAAPALPPAGVLERQHAEHHMLDKQETASRRELEREHEKEMKAAESNRSLNEELMKRQEAERHALDEQMRRNREVMEARHERERAALPPASAPSVAKHHR
jgi:hypothetical protein